MKYKKIQKIPLYFLIYFLMVGIGFVGLFIKFQHDRTKEFTVEIGRETPPSEEINVSVLVPKQWADENAAGEECIGAQYDIIIDNQMSMSLVNWEMRIILPNEARIDSSWNGEFVNTGKEIIFRPSKDRDVYAIKSGFSESCGLILHTDEVLDLREFIIVGHKDAKLTQYNLFYLLATLLFLGIIVFIIYVILEIRTKKLRIRQEQNEQIILETMQTIANFIDAKDPYTNGHSTRVAEYSVKIAEKMGMPEDEVRKIGYIALMHDCGKMGIADNVLNKPEKLTGEEVEIIRKHTMFGGKILKSMTAIEGIRDGALYHHERYDGKGYPEGLHGEEIPLCARIICVADSFDTMNSDRCYRKHLPMEVIIKELRENSGKQFDPDIVKHMIKMLENEELVFEYD